LFEVDKYYINIKCCIQIDKIFLHTFQGLLTYSGPLEVSKRSINELFALGYNFQFEIVVITHCKNIVLVCHVPFYGQYFYLIQMQHEEVNTEFDENRPLIARMFLAWHISKFFNAL